MSNICSTKTCNRIAVADRKMCQHCRDRLNRLAAYRRANGLCHSCPRPAVVGYGRCETCRAYSHHYNRTRRPQLKTYHKYRDIVFSHYGYRCVCCGEENPLFLTIDHINGRTKEEAGKGQDYRHLGGMILRGEARRDLQTLCFNCNCGRQRNAGVCPHTNEKQWPTAV